MADESRPQAPLEAGALFRQVIWARLKAMFEKLFAGRKP